MIKIHKVQIRKLWGFPVPLVSHDESYSHVSRSFGQMYLLDTLFIKAVIDFCPSLVSGHKIFLTLRGNHIPTFTSSFFGYIKQLGCPGEAGNSSRLLLWLKMLSLSLLIFAFAISEIHTPMKESIYTTPGFIPLQ